MTLPTDPTAGGGGPDLIPRTVSSSELAGIRELLLLLRDLVDRLEDRIEHLAESKG
jgi:hypothetical protein